MTKLALFISILAMWAVHVHANPAETIPADLVGEWASEKSKFSRGSLSKGAAIYVMADGIAAFIGAPPPIGTHGTATYDPATRTLTLKLTETGRLMATCGFTYEANTKTLKGQVPECGTDIFKRRSERVPEYILKMLK